MKDNVWICGKITEHFGQYTDLDQLKPEDFAEFRVKVAGKR
ncbi:MAG: hypothetical protein U0929_16280 [Planctomycetaceae bacterium]